MDARGIVAVGMLRFAQHDNQRLCHSVCVVSVGAPQSGEGRIGRSSPALENSGIDGAQQGPRFARGISNGG